MSIIVNQPFLTKPTWYAYAEGMASMLTTRLGEGTRTISVYSGTIPASANSFDPASYISQLLVTFSGSFTFQRINAGVKFNAAPGAQNATGTGTAEWFAWRTTSNSDYTILGDVGEIGSGAVLIINTTNISTGNSINCIDFGIIFSA